MSSEEGKDRSKELKHTVQNNYKGKCSYFKYVHTLQYMVHAVLHTYTPCYIYTMPHVHHANTEHSITLRLDVQKPHS